MFLPPLSYTLSAYNTYQFISFCTFFLLAFILLLLLLVCPVLSFPCLKKGSIKGLETCLYLLRRQNCSSEHFMYKHNIVQSELCLGSLMKSGAERYPRGCFTPQFPRNCLFFEMSLCQVQFEFWQYSQKGLSWKGPKRYHLFPSPLLWAGI